MKEKKLSFKWFWLCVLIMVISLLIQVVAGVVGALPASFMVGLEIASQGITDEAVITQMTNEAMASAVSTGVFLAHVLITLVFSLWYFLGIKNKQTAPVKNVFTAKNSAIIIVMSFALCMFVNFGMELVVQILPTSLVEGYIAMMETAGFGESVLTTLAAVILAPIGEELVYRGTCLHFAEKFTEKMDNRTAAFWIANSIQALFFGIFHFNIIQGSYAFLMGLVFGYLAKRYKSIFPCMLAHMIVNACSSFLWAPIYEVLPQSNLVFGLFALVFLGIVAYMFKLGGNPLKEQEV